MIETFNENNVVFATFQGKVFASFRYGPHGQSLEDASAEAIDAAKRNILLRYGTSGLNEDVVSKRVEAINSLNNFLNRDGISKDSIQYISAKSQLDLYVYAATLS
jgi:hypothetical protein